LLIQLSLYAKCGLFYCLFVGIIQGPILQNTRTHLQKSLGDDNVLLVKFSDFGWNSKTSTSSAAQEAAKLYWKFGKQGICVGHRLYRFFGNPVTFYL
jgi:RNA-dependent RNA polymerase